MAFRNYMGTNTYAIVDMIQYRKQAKAVGWSLDVYADESKLIYLAGKQFFVNCQEVIREVRSLNQVTVPENPIFEEGYLISQDCEDPLWSEHKGMLAIMDTRTNQWIYWFMNQGQKIHNLEDDKYYVYNLSEKKFEWAPNFTDIKLWDKYFGPQLAIWEFDIIAQCYKFLKTLPGFENVTDC